MNMYIIWKKKCCKDVSGLRLIYIQTIPKNITACFFSVENDKFFWNLYKNERDCYTKTLCCSVAKSCPTLCDSMDTSMPGSSVFHHFPEFAQIHVHWISDAITFSSFAPFSSCSQSFPASQSFLMSWLIASGGRSIRASASASVLPMNIQGWFF